MAGKRIYDAAVVLNVTRNVAKSHFNIRSQQLDLWSKTSSVGKAVKNQTDRVTLTVKAASVLAQRFNEPAPSTYYSQARPSQDQVIPRQDPVEGKDVSAEPKEGFQQDHHYERGAGSAAPEPLKDGELDVQQKKAARYPTRDGTIPATGALAETTSTRPIDSDVETRRDHQAGKKDPLTVDQGKDLEPSSSGRSSIPNPSQTIDIPRQEAVPEQEELVDGINTDVFHSPRIASMLNTNPKIDLPLKGAKKTPIDNTKLHKGKDQDTFHVRQSGSSKPALPTESEGSTKFATTQDEMHSLASDLAKDAEQPQLKTDAQSQSFSMRESRVPSSRFGRLWEYGGLATSMAFGAVGETFLRATGAGSSGSLMLSPANMERLVAKLSRMRGAALKLGQMMSFQDSKMLPAPIAEVLQRVQDNADYMPATQRNTVLSTNLGSSWRDLFTTFDEVPMAAASIGQVHRATLSSDGREVAVKIQYPGVATSISSDLNNLSILLTASRLLPKGLYLEKTIENARTELAWECDYTREAECQTRFRALLADQTDVFTVPAIVPEACGPQVLTADFMHGTGVTKASLNLSQDEKDWIGARILELCLRELTAFRFMQTDPNWTNFLYNRSTRKLELLDFGATRDFPPEFVNPYVRILIAASKAEPDRAAITDLSVQLGYLTGHEGKAMRDAHVESVCTLAEPFRENLSIGEMYDFRNQTITDRVRAFIPVMVRERLAPPPEETYSLHRKLSGAFLLLARLGSRVDCREMFVRAVEGWKGR